jgi:hypothetical protein
MPFSHTEPCLCGDPECGFCFPKSAPRRVEVYESQALARSTGSEVWHIAFRHNLGHKDVSGSLCGARINRRTSREGSLQDVPARLRCPKCIQRLAYEESMDKD